MQLIPSHPHKTDSKAEYKVFDRLREAYHLNNKYLAFHSLNITKHEKKRFGEADFVILCEHGLFVFEVKGGGISCENGYWYTQNKSGKHKIQDPFKQANDALHAIKKEISSAYRFEKIKLSIGYGVIFPGVRDWTLQSSEWDLNTVCDGRKFNNLELWLKRFFKYWEMKPHNNNKLSVDDINRLKQYLRPNFELVESLHDLVKELDHNMVSLTEDQYKYIDIATANNQVLCSGGAGTGKTFLAAELSRRLANEKKRIALICKSNWLKRYLESKVVNEFVTVTTSDSIKVDMRRSGLSSFDVLIVDEGQDIFSFEDIDILDSVLNNGVSSGEWYIFYDVNNQSGLFQDTNIEVLDYLKTFHPAMLPLKTNCRNSVQILNKIKDSLSLDMGAIGTGEGPEIREMVSGENSLEKEIDCLLKKGVPASSITILSPFGYDDSSASHISRAKIIKLDDYSIRSFPPLGISFSEIKNFKGLENDVIILIDLKVPNDEFLIDKAPYYVGMSRARALLSIIWV